MHRRLIQLALSAPMPLFLGIGGGILAGLCSVAQAYLLSTTVDRIYLGGSDLAGVWPWLRLFLGVIAIRGLLLWLHEAAASEVAIRIKQDLRNRVYSRILQWGPSVGRGHKTGELTTSAIEGIEALDAYYGQYLPQLAISVLVPSTILLLVFPLDPLSGMILLLTAPLIPFFMYMIGRTAEQATSHQYATLGRLSSHLLDSIQGLATLKIFGQSAAQVANIARVADKFRETSLRVLQVSFLSAFALELIATISTAIIAVEVGLRLLYGHLAFQPALFLLTLAPEFYMPLRMLGARFHAGMTGTTAAKGLFEVLDSDIGEGAVSDPAQKPRLPASTTARDPWAISLQDVGYTYPNRDHPALEQIDLDIPRGSHVAIVGASGAGKSTLAALILGFMKPTLGELRIGDAPDGGKVAPGDRLRIGWVPQVPYLFHDSIAANIRLGRPEASAEEIKQAVSLAQLDEFIASLPAGLQTIVGEGGARLSRGEAQRLAVARALLVDAPILVLDEPSSSLDPENDALLEDAFRQLGAQRTVITIAHRMKTVRRADLIIVLHHGRLVERGTHAELLAAGGAYAQLLGADAISKPEPTSPQTEAAPAAQPALRAIPQSAGYEWVARTPTEHRRVVIGHLLRFLSGSWNGVALSVLLGTLTIASSIALMGTSAWLISAAALHPSIAALQVAIVGVRLFGISRAVFRYLERLASHSVTFRLLRNIRVWFYARLEPLAPARLMDYHAGDLVNRAVADVETLDNFYVRVVSPTLTAVVVGAAVLAFLWSQDATILSGVLATGFVLAGVFVPMLAMRAARRPGYHLILHRSQLRAQLVDGIQGLAEIVAFGRTTERSEGLRRTGEEYAAAQRAMARIGGMQVGLSSIFVNLTVWLALILWIPRIVDGRASGMLLAPLALIILASFEAVSGLPQAAQMWPATVAAAGRLLEVVSVEPAVAEEPVRGAGEAVSSLPQNPATPELEFLGVGFQYPGRSQPALRDITFSLERGECVAVVGPSGAGKSTLAQLLLRFWEYDTGEIRLRGTSIRSVDADLVRAQIGVASQDPYMFDTSILENLRLARRGVQLADLELAARRAAIADFIHSLPNGFQTCIGEHGATLSTGERQRLGIARLILKDAPLLLLDEPTANLDALTEGLILDSLWELSRGRTCLFITHRLLRMERFDRVLVMANGLIREHGSHRSLIDAGGVYARMWAMQDGSERLPENGLANGK